MIIALVVAVAENGIIGKQGTLVPWHLPRDLAHFRKITLGHPVIMGRKTYESIGKPLPGRRNIIITRNRDYHAEGCETAASLDDALALVGDDEPEAYIIGGGEIFAMALPQAKKIYLTRVHAQPSGDTYFAYDPTEWHEVDHENFEPDDQHLYPLSFITLERS